MCDVSNDKYEACIILPFSKTNITATLVINLEFVSHYITQYGFLGSDCCRYDMIVEDCGKKSVRFQCPVLFAAPCSGFGS